MSLASFAPVAAQQLDSEFTVFGAYRFGGEISLDESDAVYKAKDSPSFGLIWNKRYERNTEWEVFFSRQQTEVELSDPLLASPLIDVELYTLQLGGTYLWDGDGIRPYLAMTLGGTHIKEDAGSGESDTFISGSLGLGLKLRSTERWGFRKDGEPYYAYDGIQQVLQKHFSLINPPNDLEFVTRETARTFQHSISQVTIWQKKL